MKSDVSIGLLGLGTVGCGVVRLIRQHQEELVHQLGREVKVKRILVRNIEKDRGVDIDPASVTTNPDEILNDPEIDVVVEVIGGIDEARRYIVKAIENKKHVVTANKDLIALYGRSFRNWPGKTSVTCCMRQASAAASRLSGGLQTALFPTGSKK